MLILVTSFHEHRTSRNVLVLTTAKNFDINTKPTKAHAMNNLRVFIPLFVLRLFHRIASNVNFVEFLWPLSFLLSFNCNTTIQHEYSYVL